MMPSFPIVGALIGIIWWGAAELLVFTGIHTVVAAVLLMLIPFIVAGFIHLDGYMDTSDAILSRRSREEKLRILKDPYTGAFAVIMIAILFIMQFATMFVALENGRHFRLLIIIPVISRCCSAMSVLSIKPMAQGGYVNMFRPKAAMPHRVFVLVLAACASVSAWFIAGVPGVIVAGAVILGFIASMSCAYASFKGISGDLAGFSLVVSELCGIVALAVV